MLCCLAGFVESEFLFCRAKSGFFWGALVLFCFDLVSLCFIHLAADLVGMVYFPLCSSLLVVLGC